MDEPPAVELEPACAEPPTVGMPLDMEPPAPDGASLGIVNVQ